MNNEQQGEVASGTRARIADGTNVSKDEWERARQTVGQRQKEQVPFILWISDVFFYCSLFAQ